MTNSSTGEAYHPKTGPRRTDSFTLADYTPQTLAEHLTLVEQELFVEIHPVHYLNSRAQGISVALAKPVMSKTQSLTRYKHFVCFFSLHGVFHLGLSELQIYNISLRKLPQPILRSEYKNLINN